MRTQETRFKNLNTTALAAVLVSAGLINIDDINDKVKVDQAYDELLTKDTSDPIFAVETGVTNALMRGVQTIRTAYGDNASYDQIARAIAEMKAVDVIDFSTIDLNQDLIKLLGKDETVVETKDNDQETIALDADDMRTVLNFLDAAYTAFQLAGIPQEFIDKGFEKAMLNQRLGVIGQIYTKGEVIEA